MVALSLAIPWPDISKLAGNGNMTSEKVSLEAESKQKPRVAPSVANTLVLITVAHHVTTGYGCWQHYKLDTHYNISMGIGVWANMFLTLVGLATVFIGNSGQAHTKRSLGQKKRA